MKYFALVAAVSANTYDFMGEDELLSQWSSLLGVLLCLATVAGGLATVTGGAALVASSTALPDVAALPASSVALARTRLNIGENASDIAGYTPGSDVTKHANLDLDQQARTPMSPHLPWPVYVSVPEPGRPPRTRR